jgi:hypothetical protein
MEHDKKNPVVLAVIWMEHHAGLWHPKNHVVDWKDVGWLLEMRGL